MVFVLFFSMTSSMAQKIYPGDYFLPPLDIPMFLSGNFGELRSDHFHSGIDIKTQGVTGHRVYAAAEGYISRIKIETAGYGNSIYITHPEGFTTVYGHLESYRQDIAEYVRHRQYAAKRHAMNIYPEKGEWPLEKGELIAFSGTSGYSFGPHLHFEIRDAANQEPLNVLLFGFEIRDEIPPEIYSVCVYPLDEKGLVNNSHKKLHFEIEGDNGKYRLLHNDTLKLDGQVGFGIEAFDFLDGSRNRCGLYSLKYLVDGELKFHWVMDRFSFSESRFINSFIDYEEKIRNSRSVQKTYIDPNNRLRLYRYNEEYGIVDFSSVRDYLVTFILEDAYGNRSDLEFIARGGSRKPLDGQVDPETEAVFFSYENLNEFNSVGMELKIPQGALYRDLAFKYTRSEMLPGTYSPLHHLHDPYTPLHMGCELSIETTDVPDSLKAKLLLGMINDEDETVPAGGEWDGERIRGTIRDFGNYTVVMDTVPPGILPVNLSMNMAGQTSARFNITDDFSGIASYEGYIDNEWVLFEYDQKNDLVEYRFDANRIQRGRDHELELYVIDNKDNISYYYTAFFW